MANPFDDDQSTRGADIASFGRVTLTGAEVCVTSGPEAGSAIPIGARGLWIGTSAECDLRLTDELVSRRHAELRAEREGVRIVDRGSRNGTFVGEMRVHDAVVTTDVPIRVGSTTLALQLLGAPLEVDVSLRDRFGEAVARSASMRHVFSLLEKAARTDVTVLIEGDSGTGKDVLARSLHQESRRGDEPFVVVDCGAIPESLVESELFGHEKGAFTGAAASRAGAFERANGGTIFFDEVGELPLDAQPKLLRALESRAVRRVGGAAPIQVDVRVVAATNRRLADAVKRREFREDLYYRLAVVRIEVPRLAERIEDVAPLAEMFLQRATRDARAKVPPDLLRLLCSYDWPGNARELRNVIDRFATFERADAAVLFGDPRPSTGRSGFDLEGLAGMPYHDAKRLLMEQFHRAVLPRAVERAGGSVPRAAEALGLPKGSLYRMLQEIGGGDDSEP